MGEGCEQLSRPPWWSSGLRHTLAGAFWLVDRLLFDLRVRGLEHFSNSPSTLIVCNHKTDFDVVLLVATLWWARYGRGPITRMTFAAAEQMFQPTYFSRYLLPRPPWLSRLLYPVSLGEVLRALCAYPIRYIHTRKLGVHLREILALQGDLPLEVVFREQPRLILPGAPPGARIRDVLKWTYHEALDQEQRFSIFTPQLERGLKTRHISEIHASLARFAALLDVGYPVFFAPEGVLSPDGGFGEIRAGLVRLVQRAKRDVVLLPVNLTYDFMTSGRPRAFLTVGEELREVKSWPHERLESQIKQAISGLGTVTLSQLAAAVLQTAASAERYALSERGFKEQIRQEAVRLSAREGYRVDERLLQERTFEQRWRRFVAYCRRHKLLLWQDNQIVFERSQVSHLQVGAGVRANPWAYSLNELSTLIEMHPPAGVG